MEPGSIVSSGRLVVDGIVIDVENRPWPGADVWRTSMNQVAMDVCHSSGFDFVGHPDMVGPRDEL